MALATYTPIASNTLSSNQSTVSFSSFSGYTDLRIIANIKLTGANGVYFQPNADTSSSYSATTLYGTGSAVVSSRLTTGDLGGTGFYIPGGTFSTSTYSVVQIDLMNYANTSIFKTAVIRYSTSDGRVGSSVELYAKTNAITSLVFGCDGGGSIAAGSTISLYGIANSNIGAPKAQGGVITEDNTYYYHTFGVSATFTPQQSLSVDSIVIAGGGGGGCAGGGGGAGSLIYKASQSLSATGYSVVIGGGGNGSSSRSNNGSNGGDSSFNGISATGGGQGASNSNNNGTAGGSGGGAVNNGSSGGGANAGTLNGGTGYANAGGNGNSALGAGGGGAGQAGQAATSSIGGLGGNGLSTWTSWSEATGIGQSYNGVYYLAGGGGGYSDQEARGGYGGGGASGWGSSNGFNGLPNTGGGGGASRNGPSGNGGNGGAGVVIIRYLKA
jgi:hypothetical protein